MVDPRQYWDGNLSHSDVGPSLASGQQHDHVRSHNDVVLLDSVEPSSVSHRESIQHIVNPPPPFHYSSSSLSSALTSPRTVANRYEKNTVASSACYHTGEPCAASVPIASAAGNASAVFDYGAQPLDPSLVNTSQSTQATDHTQDRSHPVYDNRVAQGQYDDVRRSVAPTPIHSPILARHASQYYSPAAHHNELQIQSISHREASPSKISSYSHYSASQGPSISLVPSGLGPIYEATDNYYRRQGLDHDLRHFVICSSESSAASNVHREFYPSPSPSLCSSVSPVDASSHQHSQYNPPSRSATVMSEGCGDYYQPQPMGQSQPQFHSVPNEPELNAHCAPKAAETGLSPAVPLNHFPVPSAQHSVSITPSVYTLPRSACALPKPIGSAAKRGPPPDISLPNPDDPNPRPAARQRPSVVRKRPDLHAPLRLSSDLPAANE